MFGSRNMLAKFVSNRQGTITVMAAITAPLMIATLALGLDFGNLTLQQRTLQKDADLASIVAASQINDAENAVLQHFQLNGRNFGVVSGSDLLTPAGKVPFKADTVFSKADGYAEVIKGRYTPDPAIAPDKRFVVGATPYDAVRVMIHQKSQLFFASSFTKTPTLFATGTSNSLKVASFSVGSRLASLDGGILNGFLGGLLGTKLSLSVMDYQTLLNADVDALNLTDQIGLDLGIKGGTYQSLLDTKITYKQFLTSLAKTTGIPTNAVSVVNQLQKSLNQAQINFTLHDLYDLGEYNGKLLGSGGNLAVKAALFDMITAAATSANAGKQFSLDLAGTIPGLTSVKLAIAIGEPPVGTPMLAVGRAGTVVRTAQTRINLTASIDGLSAIAGIKVQLPIYIEVANAEAKLSKIACVGTTKNTANVDVAVAPGVAEIALGTVDTTAFDDFGTDPRVTAATIVNSSLVKITALGHADAGNISPKTLTFSPSDILYGVMKSVSTQDTLTTLTTSLLSNLDVNVNVLFVTLGTPKAVQTALADTLATATAPLDATLYNALLVLGVKIGEADVRVTGVTCQRPVLVN